VRTLHLPARTLPLFLCLPVCLCQSACVGGHRVPARACGACAGPSCVNSGTEGTVPGVGRDCARSRRAVSVQETEGTVPGVAQGAGTACRCMRGTVLPCHVALSKDNQLLVRVRPCGPCSTIFERRSRSGWHEPTLSAARGAETGCAPSKNNPKSSDTSLDLMPTLRSFGPSFTILEGRISPGLGACAAWPSCLCVLCTYLRVPCLCFCVCQSVCASLLVLADTACLRERMVLARVPRA